MRNFKTLSIAILALTLCTISSQPSAAKGLDRHAASVMSGQKGAIVLSVDETNPVCASGELKFINVHTRQHVTGRFSTTKNIFSSGKTASIVAVPPGEYQLMSGQCVRASSAIETRQPLGHLSSQYGSIFVGAGEVVYPGTFVFPEIRRGQRAPYNLYGKPAVIVQELQKRDPALVTRFVVRPVAFRLAAR